MSHFEKALKATVRMLDIRDKVKWLHGNNYERIIAPWKEVITKVSEAKRISPVATAIMLCSDGDLKYDNQAQLLVIAATTEVLNDQKTKSEAHGV